MKPHALKQTKTERIKQKQTKRMGEQTKPRELSASCARRCSSSTLLRAWGVAGPAETAHRSQAASDPTIHAHVGPPGGTLRTRIEGTSIADFRSDPSTLKVSLSHLRASPRPLPSLPLPSPVSPSPACASPPARCPFPNRALPANSLITSMSLCCWRW